MAHDRSQVVEMWLPFEHRACALGSRHDARGISRPPGSELDLEIDAGDALDRLDDFTHGETPPIPPIERDRAATRAQIGQRIAICLHELAHIILIPDAAA